MARSSTIAASVDGSIYRSDISSESISRGSNESGGARRNRHRGSGASDGTAVRGVAGRRYSCAPCDGTPTTRWPVGPSCETCNVGPSPDSTCATRTPSSCGRAATSARVAPHACPVCGEGNVRFVSYVYGEKLGQANGRCISYDGELEKLGTMHDEFARYVVEVCLDCRWNHLSRRELHGRRYDGASASSGGRRAARR